MIADLDVLGIVVVGFGMDNHRQERARRLCLTRMLWELDRLDVGEVWLDARRSRQNAADTALVAVLRARRVLRSKIRVGHVMSGQEPLEWWADVVAGAASAALGDGDHQYLLLLEPALIEPPIVIELD